MKNKGGRPTKYRKEFCQQLIDFFDVDPYIDKEIPHYKGKDVAWTDIKRIANKLPTMRDFAKSIEVSLSAVYDWLDEKEGSFQKEFLQAYTRAKEIRKDFLIENGLNGCYNPTAFVFVAKNLTDMKDQQQLQHEGELAVVSGFKMKRNKKPKNKTSAK